MFKMSQKNTPLSEMSRDEEIKGLTHGADVDGLISGALILKRFPNAKLKTASPQSEKLKKKYDLIVDLPLPKGADTRVWIDHHRNTQKEGKFEEKIYDPESKSAASLLADYFDMKEDPLVPLAERADSVSYLTPAPTEMEVDCDPAWDVNDAVKGLSEEKRFVELAKTLATNGIEALHEEFQKEISETRRLRRTAGKIAKKISKKLEEKGADAPIIIMPTGELSSMTVSGHIVFSLYRAGAKVCAIFYGGGCWLNVRDDYDKVNAGEITEQFGGGGHKKSAGAPIETEKAEELKEKLEDAGLNPVIVNMREGDKSKQKFSQK